MTTTSERYTQDRPYPVDTLARALGLNPHHPTLTSQLVTRLHLDRRWVRRCRRLGLTSTGAEHWATRAGLHPTQVWAGWSVDLGDPDDWYSDDPPIETLGPLMPQRRQVAS